MPSISNLPRQFLLLVKSLYLSSVVTEKSNVLPIVVADPYLKVIINKHRKATLRMKGHLTIMPLHGWV